MKNNTATEATPSVGVRHKRSATIDSLTQLAKKLGPGAKLPTVRELCRSLNVAGATLERCLLHIENAGVIQRLHGKGIYVCKNILQKNIGIVFGEDIYSPGISPFYIQLMDQCARRAAEKNERFSVYVDIIGVSPRVPGCPVHRDLADALAAGKLDALVIACACGSVRNAWLRAQAIPLVDMGTEVSPDIGALVEMGVDALAKKGCKSLGIVSVQTRFLDVNPRIEACLLQAEKKGIARQSNWIIQMPSDRTWEGKFEDFGYTSAQTLLKKSKKNKKINQVPEGLLITDDLVASGVCRALEEAGIVIGKDIQIASHSNKGSTVLQKWQDKLIILEFSVEELVDALFDMLEPLMEHKVALKYRIAIFPTLRMPSAEDAAPL